MARTVNQEEFASKRKEILEAAWRLVLTKGYEQMSIQDIQKALNISSGAFHHYFGSRAELLEALTETMQGDVDAKLLPIVNDPILTALEKLQRFLDALDQLRIEQKSFVIELLRIWYADDNAVVRQKVAEIVIRRRAPLLAQIIQQGVRESTFSTHYPNQAGEIILVLLEGMGSAHARLLLSLNRENAEECTAEILNAYTAYMDAVERVLGAPAHSLCRADADAVKVWTEALFNQ